MTRRTFLTLTLAAATISTLPKTLHAADCRTLVVFFSATDVTKRVAQKLADAAGASLAEIATGRTLHLRRSRLAQPAEQIKPRNERSQSPSRHVIPHRHISLRRHLRRLSDLVGGSSTHHQHLSGIVGHCRKDHRPLLHVRRQRPGAERAPSCSRIQNRHMGRRPRIPHRHRIRRTPQLEQPFSQIAVNARNDIPIGTDPSDRCPNIGRTRGRLPALRQYTTDR